MAWFELHRVARLCAKLLPAALCALALSACGDKPPSIDVKLVHAFVDIRVMEQTLGTETPEARLARVNILKGYGYTLEAYEKAVDELLENERSWVPFQQAVVARIDSVLETPSLMIPSQDKPSSEKSEQEAAE